MRLESGTASATFSLSNGGRLASLVVFGNELLITAHEAPLGWGAYPMVPYAGRVDRGRFRFDGRDHDLPVAMAPHAIHGTVWDQSWEKTGEGEMGIDLVDPWPLGGSVAQSVSLTDETLTLTLTLTAGPTPMPAMLGWHPWFRRVLTSGAEASLQLDPTSMYEVDDDAIPTGRLIDPPTGPWDDCFTGLRADPTITWPGVLELTLSSSCTDWVVFTEREHALCVEPQTAAPDAFNRTPDVLASGEQLRATFTLAWRNLAS